MISQIAHIGLSGKNPLHYLFMKVCSKILFSWYFNLEWILLESKSLMVTFYDLSMIEHRCLSIPAKKIRFLAVFPSLVY